MSLFNINIPRDIIPLTVYMPDFIQVSTTFTNVIYSGYTETNYTTFIPQEALYMNQRLSGILFVTTRSLQILQNWHLYSMQDQVTPPPLTLWNPPIGPWPLQPIPYPFQTVPTYKSDTFSVNGI